MSLMQLQAYADVEVRDRPGKPGQIHIAQWAVDEIERLMRENTALRAALAHRDSATLPALAGVINRRKP